MTMQVFAIDQMFALGHDLQPCMAPALECVVIEVEEFEKLRWVHFTSRHHGLGPSYPEVPSNTRGIGSTIWIACTESGEAVALAFDFVVAYPEVLMIHNPLVIQTNAVLTANGAKVDRLSRLRFLVGAAHGCGWQDAVLHDVHDDDESPKAA